MGRNQTLRERIATLKKRVRQHKEKKRRELRSASPDFGLVGHWQAEIDSWKEQIERTARRLERQR